MTDGNAVNDPTDNGIFADPTNPSNKVLKLYGIVGGDWSGIADAACAFPGDFTIEANIYNGSETLSGVHPNRAAISMRQGTSWTNPGLSLLTFQGNGNIVAADGSVLQTYQTQQWYNIKIQYDRVGTTRTLQYWINGAERGTITGTISDLATELSYNNLDLESEEGSAYFDKVNVTHQVVPAVDFGGTAAASFTVDSDTEITAKSPAGTGVVDVTVDDAWRNLCDLVRPISSATRQWWRGSVVHRGRRRAVRRVTITGAGFTGATAVDFGSTKATSFTVVSDTEITATSPAGTGRGGRHGGDGRRHVSHFIGRSIQLHSTVVAGISPAAGLATGGTTGDDHGYRLHRHHGGGLRQHKGHVVYRGFGHGDYSHKPGGNGAWWT